MNFYKHFIRVELTPQMKEIGLYHARRRSSNIVRQFIPRNAPLSADESNYVGSIGEIAVRYLFAGERELKDNYDQHKTDSGDVEINSLVYDIKTEAIPEPFYVKLYDGTIKEHEPYGCRVWTAKHVHHLKKYTGGIMFAAVCIPADSKVDKKDNSVRDRIVELINHVLLIGFVQPDEIKMRIPSLYSPEDPQTGKRRKYNSLNYIFHHSELHSIKNLASE